MNKYHYLNIPILKMVPTTQTKRFVDLNIDEHFFHYGRFWIKETPEAARDIIKGGYGVCNFTIDKEDEYVTVVSIFISKPGTGC